MYSNAIITSAWYVGVAVEIFLCGLILTRRLERRWPSLLAYSALSLVVDLLLALADAHYSLRFYIYWTWIGLGALMRLWVLADVVRSFPGSSFVRNNIRIAILSAATFIAAVAWRLASLDVSAHRAPVISGVTIINSASAYAWGAFLALILLGIKLTRLGWSRQGALVGAGISVKVGGSLVTSYLVATAPQHDRQMAMTANSLCSLAAVLLWAAALTRTELQFDHLNEPIPGHTSQIEKDGFPCTL